MKYSLKKDGEKYLSKNFQVKEFRCHDGSDEVIIYPALVNILQGIRDYFGKPVKINSAYRTPTYNAKVGGVRNSQHVLGMAADIRVDGISPAVVAGYMENKIKRDKKYACGYYPISLFCHIDARATPTLFIEYAKGKTKGTSSFGFGTKFELYKHEEQEESEEEEVTQEQFNEMMDTYLAERAKEKPSDWSEDARDYVERYGIMNDGRYKSFITREEAAQMMLNTSRAVYDDGK